MTSTTNLPDTLEELRELRNSVMADYIHSRETEQGREDDEDYAAGDSDRLMATLRAIDAKISAIPKEVATPKTGINMNDPMTWPPLCSDQMTVELAYVVGRYRATDPCGVHPDQIDAYGFVNGITRAYRRGWEDAEREAR